MAASEAERPLIYAAYGDRNLVKTFSVVYEYLKKEKATVKDLYMYLLQYSRRNDRSSLFEYIRRTPVAALKTQYY